MSPLMFLIVIVVLFIIIKINFFDDKKGEKNQEIITERDDIIKQESLSKNDELIFKEKTLYGEIYLYKDRLEANYSIWGFGKKLYKIPLEDIQYINSTNTSITAPYIEITLKNGQNYVFYISRSNKDKWKKAIKEISEHADNEIYQSNKYLKLYLLLISLVIILPISILYMYSSNSSKKSRDNGQKVPSFYIKQALSVGKSDLSEIECQMKKSGYETDNSTGYKITYYKEYHYCQYKYLKNNFKKQYEYSSNCVICGYINEIWSCVASLPRDCQ